MELSQEGLRGDINWNECYLAAWDTIPDRYADEGIVGWGRSRRLGKLVMGRYKAYIGVQHVDPTRPGWQIVEAPQARFFVSMFVGGQCVALRTFSTVGEALGALVGFMGNEEV